METTVKDYITKNHILDGVRTIVLAVSGGADSMALADFMLTNFPEYQYTIAHLNHGLRQDAGDDEALVKSFANVHQVPFCCAHADIAAIASARKQGIEETGREERYRFFREIGADLILTAHHKNDTVETVLFHLIRGSGLKGVTGIAPKENGIGRPLLCVSKEELIAYCNLNDIVYAEDSTNSDTAYTRNKIRHELLPLMATLNPDVVDAIYRFSVTAAGDEEVLADAASKFFEFFGQYEGETLILAKADLIALAPPLAKRVIRAAADSCGAGIDYEMTERILALAEGKKLPLTTALWVRLDAGRYLFSTEKEAKTKKIKVELPLSGKTEIPEIGGFVETYASDTERKGSVDKKGIFAEEYFRERTLMARTRENGDKIILPDGKTKKLSDYFIDEKIPVSKRDEMLLVAVGDRILWVVGRRFFASPAENNIVIKFTCEN